MGKGALTRLPRCAENDGRGWDTKQTTGTRAASLIQAANATIPRAMTSFLPLLVRRPPEIAGTWNMGTQDTTKNSAVR